MRGGGSGPEERLQAAGWAPALRAEVSLSLCEFKSHSVINCAELDAVVLAC